MFPTQIKIKEKKFLYIKWDSGNENVIKLTNLRNNCPCAECKVEHKNRSGSYIPLYSDDQITVLNMSLAGNYALNIEWKDGHNTGIYEFQYLQDLSVS